MPGKQPTRPSDIINFPDLTNAPFFRLKKTCRRNEIFKQDLSSNLPSIIQNISVMKKVLITLLLVPVMAIMAFTVNDPLPIGAAMPKADVKMKDISGTEITLKGAMKENGLLVIFSCNTCPVVKGYQSRINEVSKWTLGQKIGVVLLNPNEASRGKGDSYED